MAGNFLDIRQSIYRPTPVMIGTGVAAASVDTLLGSIDSELQKLFEDRNLLMVDGGIFSLSADATTLIFTQNINLTLNSTSTGGPSISSIVSVAASPITFTGVGDLWYVLINRTTTTSVTSVVVAAATGLPATTYANQDVFLMGIRILSGDGHTAGIYLRGGTIVFAGQSARIGSPSTQDDSFSIANTTDPTKQIKFSVGSATTGTSLTLASAVTVNRVITFPDTTDVVATLNYAQFLTNKNFAYSVTTDSTTTGANATLLSADLTYGVVRLTNASLTSLAAIPAGTSGQILVVENQTGSTISIVNNFGGANKPIYTGSGGSINMPGTSTLTVTYDSTAAAWMLTGGYSGSVNTLNAFGSTPNANGASISGSTLTLQPASASFPGGITTGTQTFAGNKTLDGTLTLTVSGNSSIFTVNSANVTGISTSALQLGGTSAAKITTLSATTMAIQNPGSGSFTTIMGGPVNQSQPLVTIRGTINLVYTDTGSTDAGASTTFGTGFTIHSDLFNNTALGIAFDVPFASQPTIVCTIQVLSPSTPHSQNSDLYYTNSGTLGGTTDAAYGGVNGFLTAVFGADSNTYVIDFIAIGPAAF